MIVKTAKGYFVKSEKGKNLGGPYKTKDAAQKRLRQVEYFKHLKKLSLRATHPPPMALQAARVIFAPSPWSLSPPP